MGEFAKIRCTPEQEQIIYREWGVFYTKKQKLDVADFYYNKSLDINPDDPKALYYRSRCKRNIAQTSGGLADAKKALGLDEYRQPFNLEVCDGVYELNDFELSMSLVHNYSRKFSGSKVNAFYERLDVLRENFNDSLGETLGYFILGNENFFEKVNNEHIRRLNVDKRPLWKILRELKKCDCLSIPEIEKILLAPREIARRKTEFNIFNQIYLKRSWLDVLFLKALKTDENLLLPQSRWSAPILRALTKSKYEIVMRLLQMLHSRCPLYTLKIYYCPNRQFKVKQKEAFLSRIQYQVHRSMLQMLSRMNSLRQLGKVDRLRSYVEEVMGDYVVLKTRRVMPWKFQFINEVYDMYALSLIDQLVVPPGLNKFKPAERLEILFKLPKEKISEMSTFTFGKRETHQDDSSGDKRVIRQKSLSARLIRRIVFAKYPIERAYLWYEVARIDFTLNSLDKSFLVAERSIGESNKCNSKVWQVLAMLLQVKTTVMLQKIANAKQLLGKAVKLAATLKYPRLTRFMKICLRTINLELKARKRAERLRAKMLLAQPPRGGET